MNSAQKTKIIIFAGFGILILLFVLSFFLSGGDKKDDNEVSLRAIDSSEVSINDIMAQQGENHDYNNENYGNLVGASQPEPTPSIEEDNQAEIEALQQALRDNFNKQQQAQVRRAAYTPPVEESYPEEPRVRKSAEPVRASREPITESIERPITQESKTPDLNEPGTPPTKRNRFYSGSKKEGVTQVAILGNQEVRTGSNIKMVLEQATQVGNELIPKGTTVYGIATVNQSRLSIQVSSIAYKGKTIEYKKQAYDKDGSLGIYIPSEETSASTEENVATTAEEIARSTGVLSGVVGSVAQTASRLFRKKGRNTIVISNNYKLVLK